MQLTQPDGQKMKSVCSALLSALFPSLVLLTRATWDANPSPGLSEGRARDNELHLFDTVWRSQWEHFEPVQSKVRVLCLSEPFSSLKLFTPCITSCLGRT